MLSRSAGGPSEPALIPLRARTSFENASPFRWPVAGTRGAWRTRYSSPSTSADMLDTAVIPCGGLGTRLLDPITRWLPKEMLPVALRPVLHWTLDEAAEAGLLRAIIITNPHKPMLEAVARAIQARSTWSSCPRTDPEAWATRSSRRSGWRRPRSR